MTNHNRRGSLWMMAAMAGFAVEDAGIKLLARQVPLGQILIGEGLIGMIWFGSAARRRGRPALPRSLLSPTVLIRSLFELAGRLFYALAVVFAPISLVSAILQATPLVVVPLAARLFGEKVGLRRWAVTGLGFLGVLIVLHPGLARIRLTSGLAVVGMLGFAGRDLATRAAPPALTNSQLGVAGFGVLALAGTVILAVTGGMRGIGPADLALFGGLCLAGIFGYAALTRAMRTGDVSAVTPLRYTRLVFAMALGVLAFGERPDLGMIAGSALIVLCGLALLLPRRMPDGPSGPSVTGSVRRR
jgi:drug/metabolite transporter (DMT)-like permease